MAASELHSQLIPDEEEKGKSSLRPTQGGWFSFPFITGTVLTLGIGGSMSNLIVYLVREFNVKSIDAAQISNVVSGCINLLPIAGAIIADSFLGCFSVISISFVITFLGVILLTLTAMLDSLRPAPCLNDSDACETPSKLQFTVLYAAITMLCIGSGGTGISTVATMGANQFDKAEDKGIFFNWYFITMYIAASINLTAIVYIEDNIGWGLGFGICVAVHAIGLAIFLYGKKYYRYVVPQGSPFTTIVRVVVASIRKRKVSVTQTMDYYYGDDDDDDEVKTTKLQGPTPSLRFLNRAALKTEGDTDGLISTSWRLCTVKQVEDLKTLIKIFPLWSTGIFLSTTIGVLNSLIVLQALCMDRHLGTNLEIPAASFLLFPIISTAISLSIIDRLLCPMWQKLTHQSPTPLQRLGLGHVLNIISMAAAAIVESRRLYVVRTHHLIDQPGSIVPMSAFWLVVPLTIVGIGEALHFPGQVEFYYMEFPTTLRSTATAMISLLIGMGYYLSTAVIDLFRRVTEWLPDNINNGRLDNVFWMLVVVGVVNFVYYLMCARLYKYQN